MISPVTGSALENPMQTQSDLARLPERVSHNPTHIWIEPTSRCNTRCVHCGHFYERFGQDMDASLYEKIRDSALDGVERAELIGYGEPFIAKGYDEMFDECIRRGITVYSTSNGIRLRKPERLSKLVRSDFRLCLSIDGARKETFEFVRPFIKWEQMLETLECIRACAEEAGDQRRFSFRFNFVPMKKNIGDLPDLVRLAHRYGADEVHVLPLGGEEVFEKVQGESLHASPEIVSPIFLRALPLAQRLGVTLTVPGSFARLIVIGSDPGKSLLARGRRLARRIRLRWLMRREYPLRDSLGRVLRPRPPRAPAGVTYCTMPWKDSYFASDGTVFPCCVMGERLGDMNEQSWEEIWNGPLYRNLRRTIHSWNPTEACRKCVLPTGINGGDEWGHSKFFARFRAQSIALDDDRLEFGSGFHSIERDARGPASHVWMDRVADLAVCVPPRTRFIRLRISPRAPSNSINPGLCTVHGEAVEPFDNTSPDLHFPVREGDARRIHLHLEMERAFRVDGDPRSLALAIHGVETLRR